MAIPKLDPNKDPNKEELNTAEEVTNTSTAESAKGAFSWESGTQTSDQVNNPEIRSTMPGDDSPPLSAEEPKILPRQEEVKEVEKVEAKPIEKVIIERERKPRRKLRLLPRVGCGCRSCSCFGCLTIILLLVLVGTILYFRPTFLWNPIKEYMNDGYAPQKYENVTAGSVRDQVDIKLDKQTSIEITESQLQALVRDKLNSKYTRVDVEPSYLRIVQDTEEDEQHPLWLIFEIGQTSDNKLQLTKVGFERLSAPAFLRNLASDSVFKAIDTAGVAGDNDAVKLITLLMEADDEGIKVKSVRFDKDKVTIQAEK